VILIPIVTILDKVYGSNSTSKFEEIYSNIITGLRVKLNLLGITKRGWIKLNVFGEDEKIALNLLDREIGLAPQSLKNIKKFSVLKGKIVFSDINENHIKIDLGIDYPYILDAVISEKLLQGQLADGLEIPIKKLVKLFCLYDNIPLKIQICENSFPKTYTIEAQLSDPQIFLFYKWIHSRLDRLIIIGSLFSDVKKAVKVSRHSRDIIKIESLGTLEQVVLCKLGTDAIGLIPNIGRNLKSAILVPYSPKKIIKELDHQKFEL
jgi:hypothetical protein